MGNKLTAAGALILMQLPSSLLLCLRFSFTQVMNLVVPTLNSLVPITEAGHLSSRDPSLSLAFPHLRQFNGQHLWPLFTCRSFNRNAAKVTQLIIGWFTSCKPLSSSLTARRPHIGPCMAKTGRVPVIDRIMLH